MKIRELFDMTLGRLTLPAAPVTAYAKELWQTGTGLFFRSQDNTTDIQVLTDQHLDAPNGVPQLGVDGLLPSTMIKGSVSYTPGPHAAQHLPGASDTLPWTAIHGFGVASAKPTAAATNAGFIYWEVDTSIMWRSNGTAWEHLFAVSFPDAHGYGPVSARPAAASTNNGYLFWATDELKMYRSNGTTWDLEFSAGSLVIPASSIAPAALLDVQFSGARVTTSANVTIAVIAAVLETLIGELTLAAGAVTWKIGAPWIQYSAGVPTNIKWNFIAPGGTNAYTGLMGGSASGTVTMAVAAAAGTWTDIIHISGEGGVIQAQCYKDATNVYLSFRNGASAGSTVSSCTGLLQRCAYAAK